MIAIQDASAVAVQGTLATTEIVWSSDVIPEWIRLAGAVAISYAKARAEAVGATANGGLAERAERLIVVALGAILYSAGVDWGLTAALGILAVLVVITVIQRAVDVRGQLRPALSAAASSTTPADPAVPTEPTEPTEPPAPDVPGPVAGA